MKIIKATSIIHAYHLMRIRNSCRGYMTNSQDKINILSQLKWFYTQKEYECYLGYVGNKPVAYGLIWVGNTSVLVKNRKEHPYVSGGLLPKFRGQGLGRELFKFLTERACELRGYSYLTVFQYNRRAIQVYKSLGYSIVGEEGNTYHMIYQRKD